MLSQRKVDQLLANQSNTARKLYDIMTVEAKWNVHQVAIEFKNANNGNTPDRKIISGCLNDLTDSGLLKRTGADLYNKAPVRKVTPPKDMVAKMVDPIPVTARPAVSPAPAPVKAVQPTPQPIAVQPTIQKEETPVAKQQNQTATANKDPIATLNTIIAEARDASNRLICMATVLETVSLELKAEREKTKAYSEKIERLDALLAEFKL